MNSSVLAASDSSEEGSASSGAKPRFVPLRPLTARAAVGSGLLGVAMVAPMMLASSVFPLADHGRVAFTSVMLFPGISVLKHVVMGPVLEELVYRGGALPLARRYMPLWAAVAVTSAVFGATHFAVGTGTVFVATLMGVMFASLAVRFESIVPGLICHMAFNFASGFVIAPTFDLAERLSIVPAGGSVAGTIGLILPVWWIAASLALAVVATVFLRRATVATR